MSKSFKKRYDDYDDDYEKSNDSWKRDLRNKRKKKQEAQTSWMKPEDEDIKE